MKLPALFPSPTTRSQHSISSPNPTSILLYNKTSRHFSYVSPSALNELRTRKLIRPVQIPVFATCFHIDTIALWPASLSLDMNGNATWKGETVALPGKVVLGRLLGWWDQVWVVLGVEDV